MSAFSITFLLHSSNSVNSASVHVEDPGSSPLDVEPLPEPGAGVIDVLPLEPGVVEDDVPPPDVDGVMDVPPLEPGVVEGTLFDGGELADDGVDNAPELLEGVEELFPLFPLHIQVSQTEKYRDLLMTHGHIQVSQIELPGDGVDDGGVSSLAGDGTALPGVVEDDPPPDGAGPTQIQSFPFLQYPVPSAVLKISVLTSPGCVLRLR